jgi:N-glycosylase/DNA lyase
MKSRLYSLYDERKKLIKKRLNEFKTFFNEAVVWDYKGENIFLSPSQKKQEERLFEELCFCILTANTSASMSAKAIVFLRPLLEQGSLKEIQDALKKSGYRFPNVRAKYIIEAREKKLGIRQLVLSNDKHKLREFLAENIKGLGFKESSHFLRNLGIEGLAILDKHILRSMNELRKIKEVPSSLNKKKYLYIEKKYLELSSELKILPDELDLLLWSMKTGIILK